MNSADKLIDNGTVMVNGMPVPMGSLLGMERTVIDTLGNDWTMSEAFNDGIGEGGDFIPLDDQVGAGHLNARRALQQFVPGEYASDAGDVPVIGWDYGHTAMENDTNVYQLAGMLNQGDFISITLAWDRQVDFANDVNMNGAFDIVDTFQESTVSFTTPYSDDLINNLDLFLLPKGSATTAQAVAGSTTAEGTVQHIFFQIPATDEYEIWVRQFDDEASAGGQDYALAWWYGVAPPLIVHGDYNGDTVVDAQDYNVWRAGFGTTVGAGSGADGNGNGVIDAADYVLWRNALPAGSGSSLASVPETDALMLLFAAGVLFASQRRY
jgi:hypothetical protein